MSSVTPNALKTIQQSNGQVELKPTLQVINIKRMANSNMERFRLILSDGTHHQQAMLSTQQNDLVNDGQLKELCLVYIEEFLVNQVQGKTVIIVLQLSVVGYLDQRLGQPVNIDGGAAVSVGGNAENRQPQVAAQAQAAYGGAGGYGSGANPYGGAAKPAGGGGGYGSNAGGYGALNNYANGNAGGYGRGGGNANMQGGGNAPNPYGGGGGMGAAGGAGGYGRSSAPVARQQGGTFYTPISALNPYQNRWTLKGRVTNKGDIRTWSNARGEGQLFSIDILDDKGGEIRATFFRDAVDKFHPMLETGRVYTFSGGQIKVANKQFTSVQCDYEITFGRDSEIVPLEDDPTIQTMTFKFTKIADLERLETNSTCDVMGIVKEFSEHARITTKAGKDMDKRNLTIVDDSFAEIKATLWGNHALLPDESFANSPVLAFKGAKVSDFGGVSLGTFNSTSVVLNPPVPETQELRQWWDTVGAGGGGGQSFKALSSGGGGGAAGRDTFDDRRPIGYIKDHNLGHGDQPDYLNVKATVTFIKHDQDSGPWYTACPKEGCNKKVTNSMDDNWHCEKCNQTYPNCVRRYILSMTLMDFSGLTWATSFNDTGATLLGMTAEELHELKSGGQEAAFESAFVEACWKEFVLRLRVKAEMVNDEMRLKATVMRMSAVNMVTESADLINAIAKYD